MKHYTWIYDKIQRFVERQMAVKDDSPITDPIAAMNTILTFEACEGGFRLAQSLLRDTFMQNLVMSFGSDVCWLGRRVITHEACSLFVEQSAPAILDNLATFLVSPEYSCEIELGYCNREWYTLDTPDAYAARVLKSKPEYLKNDNFLDYQYAQINADTLVRPTISLV